MEQTPYSSKHYGSGDPNCPICAGLGYVYKNVTEDSPDFGKLFDCSCRYEEVEEDRRHYLRKLGGLEYLRDKTFETFKPEGVNLPERQRALLRRTYDAAFAYGLAPDGWFVLRGNFGSGKTHLAAAIANEQIEQGKKVLFVTVPDLLDHLRSSFSNYEHESPYTTKLDEVRGVDLLVLDDLGTESPTPWAMEKLFQIINHRYVAHLPTVFTTNHDFEELDPRVSSRLNDPILSQIHRITAPDFRENISDFVPQRGDLSDLSIYQHMTFSSFYPRNDLPREASLYLKSALDTAQGFAHNNNDKKWLVMSGVSGSGKTHLAAAIANAKSSQGIQVVFVTVPDLLDHLRAAYSPDSNISYDKRFHQLRTAELLILDDLGVESATPWAKEKLYQLLNYRYTAQFPTVITTTMNIEELDPRIASRLLDKRICDLVLLATPPYEGH